MKPYTVKSFSKGYVETLFFFKDACFFQNPFEKIEFLKQERNYEHKTGDIFWIYPDTKIPRFKLKQFCTKTKCYTTIQPDKATHLFIDRTSVKSLISSEIKTAWGNLIATKEEWYRSGLKDKLDESVPKQARVLTLLENSKDDEYLMLYQWSLPDLWRYQNEDFIESCSASGIVFYKGNEEVQKIFDIFEKYEDKTFHAGDLLSLLGSEVLNFERYKSLEKMINSSDRNNQATALEILANSDYDRSALYILKFLDDYSTNIYNLKESTLVNFKSLLEYFGIHRNGMSMSDQTILTKLRKMKLLSFEVLNNFTREFKLNLHNVDVMVKSSTMNDEIIMDMNEASVNDENMNLKVYTEDNWEEIDPTI